jgi:hypothetical protein
MFNPYIYKKNEEGIYDFVLNRLNDAECTYYRCNKIINYYNETDYPLNEDMGAYELSIQFHILKSNLRELAIQRDGRTYKKLWEEIIVDQIWDK